MNLRFSVNRIITIQTVDSVGVKFSKISLAHLYNHFYICIQKLIDVQTNIDHYPERSGPNPKKILYSFNPGKTNKIRYQSTSFFLSLSFEKKYYPKKSLL